MKIVVCEGSPECGHLNKNCPHFVFHKETRNCIDDPAFCAATRKHERCVEVKVPTEAAEKGVGG